MKKRILTAALSLALALIMLLTLSGCGTTAQATDLMSGIDANTVSTDIDISGEDAVAVSDLAVRLFQKNAENGSKNTLISPLSILCALAKGRNALPNGRNVRAICRRAK